MIGGLILGVGILILNLLYQDKVLHNIKQELLLVSEVFSQTESLDSQNSTQKLSVLFQN